MRSTFSLLFVFLFFSPSFSQWSVNPAGGSIRARDSMRVDSLRNTRAIGADANGKFFKSDSIPKSDLSHKAHTTAATTADTNLLAASATDSSFKKLTRAQLRSAVDSVRRADSSNGSARFGGVTKSRYDSTVFCDTPYIPKSVQSGSVKSYAKSVMRERSGYIDIPSTDTTFTAIGATDDYYDAMATDTNGNVYAASEVSGRLYRQTGGTGAFANLGVTGRKYNSLCVRKSTNELFASVRGSGGWARIYMFNGSDFTFYDSVACSEGTVSSHIVVTDNDDMYVGSGGRVFKKSNCTGPFSEIGSDRGISISLTSIGDTVFGFDFGGPVFWLIPGASDFVVYFSTNRYYKNPWVDNSGNIYVAVSAGGPTTAGIYRRLSGLSSFDFLYYGTADGFHCGTFYNGTLYAGVHASNGDIYTLSSNNQFLRTKMNIGGVTHQRGELKLYTVNEEHSESLLVLTGNNSVGMMDIGIVTDTAPPSDNKLLQSTPAGRVDTTKIKFRSGYNTTEFPGDIIQGDSSNYNPTGVYIRRAGTGADQDKDSGITIITGGGSNGSDRGSTLYLSGNENSSLHGGATISTCDTCGVLHVSEFSQFSKTGHPDSPAVRIIDFSRVMGYPALALRANGAPLDIRSSLLGSHVTVDSSYIYAGPTLWFSYGKGGILRVGSFNSGDTTILDTTGIHLYGDATQWDDEKIVATAFDYTGTGDPELTQWELGAFDNVVRVYQSGDKAYFTCQFSHGRKSGSDIYAHIHWTPHARGNEENGNTVNWVLGKTWASIDSTFPAIDTVWLNDTCTGIDDSHLKTRDILISGSGKNTSSILTGYVERAVGDSWSGTTAAQSPGFLEIDFHYEIDKLGSNTHQ